MVVKNKTWTIIDIVKWGTEFFSKNNIDSPRLTIELMICEALNIKRIDIYTKFDQPLKQNELDILRSMVVRRANKEPLQYIIGKVNFYGNELKVNNSVMIPRPETEFLVEKVVEKIGKSNNSLKILDIGTGSGCIAIAIAKAFPDSKIIALDISQDALILAEQNIKLSKLDNIELIQCDILNQVPDLSGIDVVVSNPPYIPYKEYLELEPEVLKNEPAIALTDGGDGLKYYHRFAEIFPLLLANSGNFFLEFGFGEDSAIAEIFTKVGFNFDIYKDLSDIPRYFHGYR
jgi:release factor glutamine methyltransferase